MAVTVFGAANSVLVAEVDSEYGQWAYKVLGSGVLQVLRTGQDKLWSISVEYGPTAWHKVEGTRFIKDTERALGSHGSAPQPSAAKPVTVL